MKYKIETLENGLDVMFIPMNESNIVCSLLLVNTGSINENKKNNGISHFLEHMSFKGTKQYRKSANLNKELDLLGSSYNAFTSHEYTGYHITCAQTCVNKIINILSEMYYNPLFNKSDINKERGVIIEEINMYADSPSRKIYDAMMELLYSDSKLPGLIDIAGPKKNIINMNKDDFLKYHKRHYQPNNSLLVVSGNFKIEDIKKDINKYFNIDSNIKNKKEKEKNYKIKNINIGKKPKSAIYYMKTEQSYLLIGVRAFGVKEYKKIFTLELIVCILAKGFSSRLYKKIREENGLAYFIKSSVELFSSFGHIQFLMNINSKKIEKTIQLVTQEFKSLSKKKVTKSELEIAKKQFLGHLSISLQTAHDYALFYGMNYLLTKKVDTITYIREQIEKVTIDDIFKLSKEIFTNDRLNMVIIGPYKEKNIVENIKKQLKI
jgi:predicted Zn-dependent peptidase